VFVFVFVFAFVARCTGACAGADSARGASHAVVGPWEQETARAPRERARGGRGDVFAQRPDAPLEPPLLCGSEQGEAAGQC